MDNKLINDTLNMLIAQNRVQVGLTAQNDRFGNNAVLPAEVKKIIDDVYHKIEQIVSDNNIKGAAVINLIDSKRGEISKYTETLYGQKANKQLEKMKALLENMQIKKEEHDANRDERINKEMKDERVNDVISDAVTKEMNKSIYKIREAMINDLRMRGVPPQEIEKKLTRCTMEMVNNFRRN